jgi:hypothetical protein
VDIAVATRRWIGQCTTGDVVASTHLTTQ